MAALWHLACAQFALCALHAVVELLLSVRACLLSVGVSMSQRVGASAAVPLCIHFVFPSTFLVFNHRGCGFKRATLCSLHGVVPQVCRCLLMVLLVSGRTLLQAGRFCVSP
jgi:hypothetical protein